MDSNSERLTVSDPPVERLEIVQKSAKSPNSRKRTVVIDFDTLTSKHSLLQWSLTLTHVFVITQCHSVGFGME